LRSAREAGGGFSTPTPLTRTLRSILPPAQPGPSQSGEANHCDERERTTNERTRTYTTKRGPEGPIIVTNANELRTNERGPTQKVAWAWNVLNLSPPRGSRRYTTKVAAEGPGLQTNANELRTKYERTNDELHEIWRTPVFQDNVCCARRTRTVRTSGKARATCACTSTSTFPPD
jgi:hypothetical protein